MPIDIDIREHELLGPMLKAEFEAGFEEGLQQATQIGMRTILRLVAQKRFGALPGWAVEKLASLSASELEDLSLHVLDVNSLEELLR